MNPAEILEDVTKVDELAGEVIKQLKLAHQEPEVAGNLFGILAMRIASIMTEDKEEFFVAVEILKQGIDVAVYG